MDKLQSHNTETSVSKIEARFFQDHSSSDPTIVALMEYFERKNNSGHFIAKTVERIGYPYWDKALSVEQELQTNLIKTNTIGVTTGGTAGAATSTIVYIPFVREEENQVNAALVFTVTTSDTSFLYVCDWQYKSKEHGLASLPGTAENHAVFFYDAGQADIRA